MDPFQDQPSLESAVRETVSLKHKPHRVHRSHTSGVAGTPTAMATTTTTTTKQAPLPPTPTRRSISHDSVTQTAIALEKARKNSKSANPNAAKKGSTHADVIDRLDFTGVGPMFHHDGPFDACAPSRNRHRTKAPMLAWASPQHAQQQGGRQSDSDDPPVSAAQLRKERREREAEAARQRDAQNVYRDRAPYGYSNSDSPYPSSFPPYPRTAPAGTDGFEYSYAAEQPKKQVDRIAEAWGTHVPEPYEEFFSAGPQGDEFPRDRGDHERERDREPARDKDKRSAGRYRGRSATASAAERDVHYDGGVSRDGLRRAPRSAMPPPQPIFSEDENYMVGNGPENVPNTAGGYRPGAPKRTKSLMQRIRKMRDAPNVPVDKTYEEELAQGIAESTIQDNPGDSSPNSSFESQTGGGRTTTQTVRASRPTHRSQNSFFGRFGRTQSAGAPVARGNNDMGTSPPTSPGAEKYVFVSHSHSQSAAPLMNKALPVTPGGRPRGGGRGGGDGGPVSPGSPTEKGDYFSDPNAQGGAQGLGRKTSLLKKVRGVVRK